MCLNRVFLNLFFSFVLFSEKKSRCSEVYFMAKKKSVLREIRVIVNLRKVNSCCSKSLFTKKIEEKNRAS